MPEGVMQWFDERTGEAEVLRRGRHFHARVRDVDVPARVSGARVHFDVRKIDGVDQAVEVRLRDGHRSSPRHHRFGSLAGSRSSDEKASASYLPAHPELRSGREHPLEIARSWASSLAGGDVAGAACLYASDAQVHLSDRVISGRGAVEAWLSGCAAAGSGRHARIEGLDGDVSVGWDADRSGFPGMVARCHIRHAEIAEQWIFGPDEPALVTLGGARRPAQVTVVCDRAVPEPAKAVAVEAISKLVAGIEEPVLFARVKLGLEPDPARPRPASAAATIDLNGDLVRAHVAAPDLDAAVELLARRLRERIERRADRYEGERKAASPRPTTWRHGASSPERPAYFDRPVADRQLVRHKTFATEELTPDEAVFDMGQLDYDFYLFGDLATGLDALVEPLAHGVYRMTRIRPADVELGTTANTFELSATAVPVLEVREAIERLELTAALHVFFVDASTGRGEVVYRRYDGHYGLLTPA